LNTNICFYLLYDFLKLGCLVLQMTFVFMLVSGTRTLQLPTPHVFIGCLTVGPNFSTQKKNYM